MPTFNQLVRKGRQTSVKKSTAPASAEGMQLSYTRRLQILPLLRREVFVPLLRLLPLRSLTQLCERSPEFVFPTESK